MKTARFFVGTRKGLFRLQLSGDRWSVENVAFLGDPVTIVTHDPRDGTLLASLDHGHFGTKLHRSLDEGVTWDECPAPVYPAQPEGEQDKDSFGNEVPWKLKLIWAIEPGGADQRGDYWCGTIPGGLFRTEDLDQGWQLVRSLWDHPDRKQWFGGGMDQPGIHSVCVDPRDASHVRVAVSCGGVWVTRDQSTTWECQADGMWAAYMPPERRNDPRIQDAHRMVQCRQAPDHYWVQHHNGIFRSTDNCKSWYEVQPEAAPSFGFAVTVHPQDPNLAWFVPAISDEKRIPADGKVVVTRTRDGGKTFDVLRNGLPQANAYDLVYRHAMDVDASGDILVFGSTTGSVWASVDQGDQWSRIAQHLPPVYCVRAVES